MEADFATAREAGVKMLFRISYTTTAQSTAPYGDATKDWMITHASQLKPIVRANADVIHVVQAGFIGTWGRLCGSMCGCGCGCGCGCLVMSVCNHRRVALYDPSRRPRARRPQRHTLGTPRAGVGCHPRHGRAVVDRRGADARGQANGSAWRGGHERLGTCGCNTGVRRRVVCSGWLPQRLFPRE